ncbi:uncharacterized protein LOC132054428 [Lycium ferocissimum]|uniref:uncharacterized protein LOC132054428 n=1 Tax=Lycium ferocissimum TaxID=112874 RepID=UPI00281528D6|nr:uncharacterized protein LOC132054428 [Lycium ferocissimum]XP_059302428.1 uncharacterized protein LOC132054428 [Lycium ferocissimum]XP_059302435.1 uncharacterized protein LOC132054428 [Lycium ferocissimum]
MDCNKDEALRAKEVAEKKMLNNDFEGAKKIAEKAERLYPQLENISQLLTVCNVHCSAQSNRVGSERDWYGILQIDRFSDELTIKKQYRRLALMLHPDKNKLPGAEAAFKLIVEANMVLSDQVKRSLYDNKYRVISGAGVAKQPPHLVNRNSFVRQNNIPNGFNAQFSNLNHHKYTQPTSSAVQETFWTQCPSCKIRYQYYSNYVNSVLRCQKCLETFTAYDLGYQGAAPCVPKWSQPGGQAVPLKTNLNQPSEQKELPNQGTSKMTAGSAGFPPTQMGYRSGFSSRTAGPEPEKSRGKTAPVFENIRTKQKDVKHEKLKRGKREGPARPKVDRKSRKRSRKQIVESSESDDTSTSVETEDVEIENGNDPPAGQGNGADSYGARRSSRRRQNISYSEGVSGDETDLASPLKKARSNQSAGDSKPRQKEAVGGDDQHRANVTMPCSNSVERLNQNGVGFPEGDVQNNNSKIGTVKEQASRPPSGGGKKVELIVDSDSEPDTVPDSNLPEVYDYPDPEFSDFDKLKAQNCFAIDQIWACYDTADSMPRFYAHIRKVYSPEFKVMFTWLEAHPEDQRGRAWVTAELPVGCGKFRRGSTEFTSDRLTFSHQVQCEMGKRGLYIVYPRKGETWALFKDWDISWGSDPDNHRKYKYEIVEILSDYVVDVGVQVGYLDKMTRFVSLFKRTRLTEVGSFFVKPNELYKFSHRIPSFKMTGTEGEGVPAGSFELDPASLPVNPDDIWYPEKVMQDNRAANSEPREHVSPAVPPGTSDKSRMSENVTISLKSGEVKGIRAANREFSKVRRSPRGVNLSEEKQSNMSSRSANDSPSPDFDDNCVKSDRHSSASVPSHLSSQADEELHPCTKNFDLSNSSGTSKNPITLSDDKGFEEVFCDFRMDISVGKFQVDQVWALYGQNRMPRTYAQIKKIFPAPFKLHVVLLEAGGGPKNAQSGCGTFKIQNERHQVYAPSSFSHVVKAVSINRNRFEIYPREGDIWALYKNWKKLSLHPDTSEYEIVEVIENSKDRIKVSSMVRVNGFKSVFRSPRIQRSNPSILEIPKDEFGRFSHQIPAFQLTGEKGGVLRGCWELDPASVPCSR